MSYNYSGYPNFTPTAIIILILLTKITASLFAGLQEHLVIDTGHNVPQEDPQVFADAVIKVHDWIIR